MVLCGLDLETSGLTIGTCKILEVCCALYDTSIREVFECWTARIYCSTYPPILPEASLVNGLTADKLKGRSILPLDAFNRINSYLQRSMGVVAHNGLNFDLPFLKTEFREQRVPLTDIPWIDTRVDLPYPSKMRSKGLQHLAVDHGIAVDPSKAHSAEYDVRLMFEICKFYDLEEAFKRCKSPIVTITCHPPISKNHEAKNQRYRWDAAKKHWWKDIRECDFEKEQGLVSFAIERAR